mmetsp:Transcript_24321/g.78433  ORF Transcript_24321/g.78433 Transcript_24321/m.78433 type:complete len:258 (-) Transcript_24321:649-1422(-)
MPGALRRGYRVQYRGAQAFAPDNEDRRLLYAVVRALDGLQHREQGAAQCCRAAMVPLRSLPLRRQRLRLLPLADGPPQASAPVEGCHPHLPADQLHARPRPHRRGSLRRRRCRLLYPDRQGSRACLHRRPLLGHSGGTDLSPRSGGACAHRLGRRARVRLGAVLHLAVLWRSDAVQPGLRHPQHPLARLDGQAQGGEHDAGELVRSAHNHVLLVGLAVRAPSGGPRRPEHMGRRDGHQAGFVHPAVYRHHGPILLSV